MSGWDAGGVTSLNLNLSSDPVDELVFHRLELSSTQAHYRFRQFLRTFKAADNIGFPYRDLLTTFYRQGQFRLAVDLRDLHAGDPLLHDLLLARPSQFLPIFEAAATEVARVAVDGLDLSTSPAISAGAANDFNEVFNYRKESIQVQLIHHPAITPIRDLSSSHVSHLVSIAGIVVSAGKPRVKPLTLHIICRNCKVTRILHSAGGFSGAKLPRVCDSKPVEGATKCGLDPFIILSDSTTYIDQQRLKLQEMTGTVPTGEMPRVISLACDRYLCGAVKPGTRVKATGMYTTYESNGSAGPAGKETNDRGIRIPYLRVMGLETEEEEDEWGELTDAHSSDGNTAELDELAAQGHIYEKIANSICPAIFDNEDTRNIKQALAVQLFGGSRKLLPDGMRLRGDINMLLLGDPSVAKSQFLKFVSAAAPIGVYTSGKGSSAAGLTASVVRDAGSGEFHLEGGALVLADGGLVAIDEFDKMREQDRVAIHEAMEQQTISIAKAGITTILNSRTAVLAAANPIFGRYDDMRTATENIDFQTSILSRFDLIFIVRDVQDERRDTQLALHVLNVHRNGNEAIEAMERDAEHPMIPIPLLKRYISYAKARCQPRLNEAAATTLKNHYVRFRQSVQRDGTAGAIIPITVRQLEAVVRISEALARMELSEVADERHVKEAIRLFQVSTYRAAMQGGGEGARGGVGMVGGGEFERQVLGGEKEVRLRMPAGSSMGREQLVTDLERKGIQRAAAERAIENMAQRNELAYLRMRKVVKRM